MPAEEREFILTQLQDVFSAGSPVENVNLVKMIFSDYNGLSPAHAMDFNSSPGSVAREFLIQMKAHFGSIYGNYAPTDFESVIAISGNNIELFIRLNALNVGGEGLWTIKDVDDNDLLLKLLRDDQAIIEFNLYGI